MTQLVKRWTLDSGSGRDLGDVRSSPKLGSVLGVGWRSLLGILSLLLPFHSLKRESTRTFFKKKQKKGGGEEYKGHFWQWLDCFPSYLLAGNAQGFQPLSGDSQSLHLLGKVCVSFTLTTSLEIESHLKA